MYSGANFPLEVGEELIIGRDAALCHIVLNRGAEKISRQHCVIRFDTAEQMYVVTDLSSNGTYLNNGTQLSPNTPTKVPRGGGIYLATQTNQFNLD
jgi:pSer/pThr/pTyr-binding forkhead associated (FHA) protein